MAYIYSSDISSANGYKSLLDSNGLSTSLIYRGDAVNSDFSKYNLIIIGSDLDITGSQDDVSLVSVIDNSGKPVLALGEGGYYFLGQLKLKTGYPNGWHGSENSIFVINSSKKIFKQPYAISIPENNILQLYTSTGHVGISLLPIPSNVIPLGRESGDPDHYPLTVEKNKYILWGFTGSPDIMTEDGKYLFVNIASNIVKPSKGKTEPEIDYRYLTITSTPENANVFIDGIYMGKTPIKVYTDSRKHLIYLELEGYDIWVKEIKKDQNNVVASLNQEKPGVRKTTNLGPQTKYLNFTSNKKATVYLEGTRIGDTPCGRKCLQFKTYKYLVKRPGYNNLEGEKYIGAKSITLKVTYR